MSMFLAPSKNASKFLSPLVDMAMEAGLVSALIKWGTTDSTTPAQRSEAQAQEDLRQAAMAREDARRQEAQAEDDRRRAYFANQAPSL